jgi:hypothetical protein
MCLHYAAGYGQAESVKLLVERRVVRVFGLTVRLVRVSRVLSW